MNSLIAPILAKLSTLLNDVAQQDIDNLAAIKALDGQSLALYHDAPSIEPILVSIVDNQIQLRAINEQDQPNAYIVGSSLQIAMALAAHESEAAITGDISQWQGLIAKLNINWQQLLQPLLGAEVAAAVGAALSHSVQVRQNALSELARLADNFRKHEQGLYEPFPTLNAATGMIKDMFKNMGRQ